MENIGGVGDVTRVSGEGGIQEGDIGGFIGLEWVHFTWRYLID